MLGHVAQSIGKALPGASEALAPVSKTISDPGSGSYTVPRAGRLHIFAIGGGAGGQRANDSASTNLNGGGGGGAVYKAIDVNGGEVLNFTVGAAGTINGSGGQTKVTLPNGQELIAAGAIFLVGRPSTGGVASGGDVNRTGGNGGSGTGNVPTAGQFGGRPGTNQYSGGSSAGFSDFTLPALLAGDGAESNGFRTPPRRTAGFPGGGGTSGQTDDATSPGASGAVQFLLV